MRVRQERAKVDEDAAGHNVKGRGLMVYVWDGLSAPEKKGVCVLVGEGRGWGGGG
jgi:hypothetical protein